MKKLIFLAVLTLAAVLPAGAVVQISVTESNSSVWFMWNGTLNMTGTTNISQDAPFAEGVAPRYPAQIYLRSAGGNAWNYLASAYPTPGTIGSGAYKSFTTVSGNQTFKLDLQSVGVSDSYANNSLLAGTNSIDGETISSLGINAGTFTWTLQGSSDQVVMTVVPEPSTYAMIGAGALGLLALRRRRA